MHTRSAGEGTIFLRKDGRWCAQLRLPDGKRKSVFGHTKQEAADKLAEFRRSLAS
jgi:hypothetical protein